MTIAITLMIICSFLIAVGQYLFKVGSGEVNFRNPIQLLLNKNILCGFLAYLFYFILSVIAYKYGDLMVLAPMTAICGIWTILIAKKGLGESITLWRYAGISLILAGCTIISL